MDNESIGQIETQEDMLNELMAAISAGFLPAVFIGHGKHKRREEWPNGYNMCGVWPAEIPLDIDGNILPALDENGQYRNPATLLEFYRWDQVRIYPGEICFLPAYDETCYNNALKSKQFAQVEFLEKIESLYTNGLSGDEIFEIIEKENGLIEPIIIKN